MDNKIVETAEELKQEIDAEKKEDDERVEVEAELDEILNIAAEAGQPGVTPQQAEELQGKLDKLNAETLKKLRDEMRDYKRGMDERIQTVEKENKERSGQFEQILAILENANKPEGRAQEQPGKPEPQTVTPGGGEPPKRRGVHTDGYAARHAGRRGR